MLVFSNIYRGGAAELISDFIFFRDPKSDLPFVLEHEAGGLQIFFFTIRVLYKKNAHVLYLCDGYKRTIGFFFIIFQKYDKNKKYDKNRFLSYLNMIKKYDKNFSD